MKHGKKWRRSCSFVGKLERTAKKFGVISAKVTAKFVHHTVSGAYRNFMFDLLHISRALQEMARLCEYGRFYVNYRDCNGKSQLFVYIVKIYDR